MDYKKVLEECNARVEMYQKSEDAWNVWHLLHERQCADAITDLLARAEAAETRVHELETTHRTQICEDGYDCVELGNVRRKLEAAEDRAEKAQTQLREAKHCVAGLSILIKAVDGKMVMETVLPMARNRLEQYKQKYPSGKVVLDTQKEK